MDDDLNTTPPILPRSAWESSRDQLRALFKAKKALDEIESLPDHRSRQIPGDSSSQQGPKVSP